MRKPCIKTRMDSAVIRRKGWVTIIVLLIIVLSLSYYAYSQFFHSTGGVSPVAGNKGTPLATFNVTIFPSDNYTGGSDYYVKLVNLSFEVPLSDVLVKVSLSGSWYISYALSNSVSNQIQSYGNSAFGYSVIISPLPNTGPGSNNLTNQTTVEILPFRYPPPPNSNPVLNLTGIELEYTPTDGLIGSWNDTV